MSFNPFTQRCTICNKLLFFWQDIEAVPEGKVHIACRIDKIDAEKDKLRKEKRNAYERARRNTLKSDESVSIAQDSKKGEELVATSDKLSCSTDFLPSKEQIEQFSEK